MKKKWYRLCACALAVNLLLSGAAFALELPEEDGQPEAIEAPLTEAEERPETAEAPLTEAAEQPEAAEAPLNEAEEQPETAEAPLNDAEEQPEAAEAPAEEPEEEVTVTTEEVVWHISSFDEDETALFEERAVGTWGSTHTKYGDQLTGNAKTFYNDTEKAFQDETYKINNSQLTVTFSEVTQEFNNASDDDIATWAQSVGGGIADAAIAFTYDHPEYFWIRFDIAYGYTGGTTTSGTKKTVKRTYYITYNLYSPYNTQAGIDTIQGKVDTVLAQIQTATQDMDTYEKLEYFDNWLAANNKYNEEKAQTDDALCRSAISGLLSEYSPVCEGYAKAFQWLCSEIANVPCIVISGNAINSSGKPEGHMWNAVQLDGTWYFCDPTWDDPLKTGGGDYDYSSKTYFLVGKPSSHTADTRFGVPTLSDSGYVKPSYEGFTLTNSAFTGSVKKATNGDLWVALYDSTGKMLVCKKAIAKGLLKDGDYGYLAPSFNSDVIRSATKAVVYHVDTQWKPIEEKDTIQKPNASAMVPMEAVTASYEQLAFAASPAEIEPMEPIWGRYDALEASADDAALLEDSTVEWPEGALDYKAQMTGDLKLFYEQLEAAFQNNSWDVTSMGENEKAWACATVVCTGEPVIVTNGDEYSAWYQQTYMNLNFGMRTLGTAFVQDHPEYFWIRSAFQYHIGQAPITMTEDGKYQTGAVVTFGFELMPPYPTTVTPDTAAQVKEEVLRLNEERQRVIDAFTERIREETKDSNDYETVRYIDNWLSWWNRYNSAAVTENYARSVDSTPWTIAGSIGNPSGGNAVCEGYAKGFQYLCKEVAGVPCVTISGGAAPPTGGMMNHMWNAVQLDGTWYFCDPTWNDLTGGDSSDYSLSSGMFFLSTSATGMHLSTQDRPGMSGVNLAVPPQATEQYKMAFNGFELKGVFFTGGKKTDTDGEIWVALYDENGAMTECEKAYKVSPEDGGCGYRAPKFPKESISGAAKAEVFHLNPQWQPVQNAPKETIDRQ